MSITERLFLGQVRHVAPVLDDSRTLAARRQIIQDFGALVPPFALHLPVPDALCAFWAIARETSSGRRVDRATKEAVAVAVSATNSCPFCVDVHSTTLRALGERSTAGAIASGETDQIEDADLRAKVTWARANRQPDSDIVQRQPFPDEHAPELIGTALAYHYINRMVNIFAPTSPFPSAAPKLKPIFKLVATPVFRTLLRRDVRPGASLSLLSPAQLPADLGWARSDPIIADAFGRAAAAFDAVGHQAVPEAVQELVAQWLSTWRGDDPGLSRGWVDSAVQNLPIPHRPIARFALLAAIASYQVDSQVLDDARTSPGAAGDAKLVAAASWASFAAARRIGSWLNTVPATATHDRKPAPRHKSQLGR
ncbi:MAG: carboxymuconolactone decarboxylase family protein [Mycobacterium sp.]